MSSAVGGLSLKGVWLVVGIGCGWLCSLMDFGWLGTVGLSVGTTFGFLFMVVLGDGWFSGGVVGLGVHGFVVSCDIMVLGLTMGWLGLFFGYGVGLLGCCVGFCWFRACWVFTWCWFNRFLFNWVVFWCGFSWLVVGLRGWVVVVVGRVLVVDECLLPVNPL